jgi:hypothetical protein
MLLKTWYFITISLAALLMGTTFCHVLEMPPKMHYPAALYLTLHRTLYRTFGTFPGPFIEIGSILAAAVLSLFVRDHRPAFYLSLLAAVCLVAAFFGVWVAVIAPVNAEMFRLTPESAPEDWARLRERWEYSHAARFVLHLVGFSALVLSVLSEIPRDYPPALDADS